MPFLGCEKKPTAEEIESARRIEEAVHATPAPTPKPGEWMYEKDRKTRLDEKPRR